MFRHSGSCIFRVQGEGRGVTAMRMAAKMGKKVMASQSYEIRPAVSDDDYVALEVDRVGTLAVPHESVPGGGQMRGHLASWTS